MKIEIKFLLYDEIENKRIEWETTVEADNWTNALHAAEDIAKKEPFINNMKINSIRMIKETIQ